MSDHSSKTKETIPPSEIIENSTDNISIPRKLPIKNILFRIFFSFMIFISGLGSGYLMWGRNEKNQNTSEMKALISSVNPQQGYVIPATYGDVGPQLIASGAINPEAFELIYQEAGKPLNEKQKTILAKGSQDQLVIDQLNSYFLLNFLWALGLTNKNKILDEGLIQQVNGVNFDQFASTGGWTLGQKPVKELFSSISILNLTDVQQARVEEVAEAIYRPCCNNNTSFPDCNHGMAMLGLLELLVSQNNSIDEMFNAAKHINAYWFQQQTLEQAIYLKSTRNLEYQNIDPRTLVGKDYSSIDGFRQVHQWLLENNKLQLVPQAGNNCNV